ncbi:MAG: hypothetical protein R6U21_07125 [Thermoplasmatota archaeon]
MNSKEKMILPPEITEAINGIESDTQSGATTLTKQGIQTVHLLLKKGNTSDQQILQRQIKQTLLSLIHAQPMMASFVTYANTILLTIEKQNLPSIQSLKKLILAQSNTFLTSFSQANKKISIQTLPLLTDNTTVFTYSNSSSVFEALRLAHKKGIKINVYCSESRPTDEGKQLSKTLSKQEINTTFSTDAALFSNLAKADLILIGADTISKEGLIHKIGTSALACLANYHNIPIYSLSAEEKMIPATYKLPAQQTKNPREILTNTNKQLTLSNYYFDCTPLSLITEIITQKGRKQPKEIVQHLNTLPIHESLQA